MGDNFDPCECIWGHELAMRRLLSLLRNSQSYCTDAECFRDGDSGNTNPAAEQGVFFMSLLIVFAMFMYYIRPSAQRNPNFEEVTKPNLDDNDSNGAPPSPPPTSS